MRVLVYFKPKESLDNFEGTRLRKTIKGALEINNIAHTSIEVDHYDVAHFISLNDEARINTCLENHIPVVMSALYCESDPQASFLDYTNKKSKKTIQLSSKGYRVLNKVNLVLAPTEKAKQFLIDSGITTPIEVVSPGINVSRFNLLRDDEKEIFYRYFQQDKNKKLILAVGSYDNIDGVGAFISCAKKHPECIFYYFTQSQGKMNRETRKLFKKSPKNCHSAPIPQDDIYRSALINSEIFMYVGYDTAGIVSVFEAMAAQSEIIIRSQPLFDEILVNEDTCHIGQYSETLTAITNDYLDKKIYPTKNNAFKYATSQGLDVVGARLKEIYQKLIKGEY